MLKPHPEQHRMWHDNPRFQIVHAGRRSGKTEIGLKRRCVVEACKFTAFPDGRFVLGAPISQQAKRIFFRDIGLLIPEYMLDGKPNKSELKYNLKNGAHIQICGLDEAARIEGDPIDWIGITEMGNVKPGSWGEHIRPAISTPGRLGAAVLEGVPEGAQGDYYETMQLFEELQAEKPDQYGVYWWKSSDILDPDEITDAKRSLDTRTFRQEYEGSFESWEGRAYYSFVESKNVRPIKHLYKSEGTLIICFDFNVEPGSAVLGFHDEKGRDCLFDEVHIERDSNTLIVCRRILEKYGSHQGSVFVYGDATGGARGTAKVSGSDWDLISGRDGMLSQHFGRRLKLRVPAANPRERARVNAVNSRLRAANGDVNMLIDPQCKETIKDFNSVGCEANGSIDKKTNKKRTHWTDALGYEVVFEHPIVANVTTTEHELF